MVDPRPQFIVGSSDDFTNATSLLVSLGTAHCPISTGIENASPVEDEMRTHMG